MTRPEGIETPTAVPESDAATAPRERSARYASTTFENVVYKGTAIYIRIPSPHGGRVRRRTSCDTPRQAAELLGHIDALVIEQAEPLWWPIRAVLNDKITIERLAHFLLNPRNGGLAALRAEMDAPTAPAPAPVRAPSKLVSEIIDEYAALKVHGARDPRAMLEPETVKQYIGHMRTAAVAMRTLVEWSTDAVKEHLDSLETTKRNADGVWELVPVKPATHRRHLWALLTLGDFFVRKGYLPINPAEAVVARAMTGTYRKKLVWLSHAEWIMILAHIPAGMVKDALEFMLATATEPGATSDLTGDKVRAYGTQVTIDTNRKGGAARQRTVAVDTGFQTRLATLAAVAGSRRVFPGCSVALLGSTLDRVRSKLAADGFAKHYLIHPYELRHTWACESLEAGALIHDVSAQLGHSKVSTTQDIYGPGRANADRVNQAREQVTAAAAAGLEKPVDKAVVPLPTRWLDDVTW